VTTRGLASSTVVVSAALLTGCSAAASGTATTTSTSDPSADARSAWHEADALAGATQAEVPGGWLADDSAAGPCGAAGTGARWGLTRIGPSTSPSDRADVVAAVASVWSAHGYDAVERAIGGDAPGVRLRFPASGTLRDGFFIEFVTTAHASTIQLQTPCRRGDDRALNAERYAERHTDTPPDVPGATASPRPSGAAGP